MSPPSAERVPKQMQPKFAGIVSLTDNFCQEHLNDEREGSVINYYDL